MKFDFLLCGSPNDAFYSQFAFFRRSLDTLGDDYYHARLVAVVGADECAPLPDRWRPHFERIELVWADPHEFRRVGFYAQGDYRFEQIRPDADLACLCDSDTVMVRPFPGDYLDKMRRDPAIGGVIAHYPFPLSVDHRCAETPRGGNIPGTKVGGILRRLPGVRRFFPERPILYPEMHREKVWEAFAHYLLGRPPRMQYAYTLQPGNERQRCPFYVNYGFVAGSPRLHARLYRQLRALQPRLSQLMGNDFYGQVAIALAVEKARLPHAALPMRYNFPNDPNADAMYPEELDHVILVHYLRTSLFDRQQIFASQAPFDRFCGLTLSGSNAVFQQHVLRVTGGVYPFS